MKNKNSLLECNNCHKSMSPLEQSHLTNEDDGSQSWSCDTYKTAERYQKELQRLYDLDCKEETTESQDAYENCAHEFLHDLLEDYRVMLNKEIEYLQSNESVDESIRANEYEFTEN